MNRPSLFVVAVTVLILAACGADGSEPTSTTTSTSTTQGAEESTTTPSPSPQGQLLSYNLEDGTTFSYQVDLNQQIEVSASGDPSAMGDDGIPGEATIEISGSAMFTHTVSDGPEPGTYEVNIKGAFDDLTVTGTVDGEPVDEAPEFVELEPIDVTFLIDDQGNLIYEDETLDDPFGGIFGGLEAFGSGSAPGLDPGQFVGPPFPDEEVSVGDIWTDETETFFLGDDPVVTSTTSTIVDVDQINGVDVFVIETQSSTSLIEIDLGEFFLGLFTAFMPENPSDEEKAELQVMLDQLKFTISVDGTRSDSTTWFDPEAGIALRSDVDVSATISMDINVPDETTGELVGFQMEMGMTQQISYQLLDSPGA